MSLFAVTREAGPGWIDGKGAFEQPRVTDHTAFMNALSDDGFLLLAGPLGGSEQGRIRVLLIVDAAGEEDIHRHFAEDPWAVARLVVITSIEPWIALVGAERLSVANSAH